MFNLEFNIGLNDVGRPIIEPTKEAEKLMALPEYKFMALEYTRSLVSGILKLHEQRKDQLPIDEDKLNRLRFLELEIEGMSDMFAVVIKNQFQLMGVADQLINKQFDVAVLTFAERDALNYNGIIFNEQIFVRAEGLRVKVLQTGQVFQLVGGVDNEHWTEV